MSPECAASGIARAVLLTAAWQLIAPPPPVAAEVVPPRGAVDSRIRATPYDREQVYRLRGFVGFQIDLEFEPGETFVGLGAGDLEGLSYMGQDNHLFLKPKAANVATNLTVLTNRRQYQFDYAALSGHPAAGDPTVIFAVRFTYPAAAIAPDAVARQIDAELDGSSSQRRQNLDYWYCGGPALRPIFAADDGVHTRLRFAANAELPAIFVRSEDGGESLLNFNVENGDVVIHRVARQFVLRRGALVGCIVNQGFVGGGVRLESGTVAPRVERRLQGAPRE
jgi:type IV secretion system protein VirB9